MKAIFKQLGKDSLIYGVGGILGKGIGLFLLPIYTRIFNPAEYGILELLVVIGSFVGSIVVMGMDAAQSFYFFEQKENGQEAQANVVTAILQWRISYGMGILIIAILISPVLNRYFFNGQLSWQYFAVGFTGIFCFQIMNQSAEIFRLLYRPVGYIAISLGQTIVSAAVGLLLILGFGYGILGFLWGSLIGALLLAVLGWYRLRVYLQWSKWHLDWWPRLVKFGAPLVPAAVAMYVLNVSDRWFISYFSGAEALGIFAVGAKFAMLIIMAVTVFRQAWWPVAMEVMHRDEGPALYRTMGRLYLGCGSAAIVLITALSPTLVAWFAAPAYASAYPIVGVLAWHSIFYGFYLIGNAGIWKAEKTAWSPLIMGFAALLNIGLNYCLVPRYGGLGAAIATSTSFGIWNLLTLIVSERLWPVGYAYAALGAQLAVGLATCALILILYHHHAPFWTVWAFALVAVFLLLTLSASKEHLGKIMTLASRKVGATVGQIII